MQNQVNSVQEFYLHHDPIWDSWDSTLTPILPDVCNSDIWDEYPEVFKRKVDEAEANQTQDQLTTPISAAQLQAGRIASAHPENLSHNSSSKQKGITVEPFTVDLPAAISRENEKHPGNFLYREFTNINSFMTHERVEIISDAARFLTRHLRLMVLEEIEGELDDNQIVEAKKIWSNRTLIPFVHTIISRNLSVAVWRRTMRITTIMLAVYHREFLVDTEETDYEKLANFLIWLTDVLYSMVNPVIGLESSEREKKEPAVPIGRRPNTHPLSRIFMSLHDQASHQSTFVQTTLQRRALFTESFLSIWKQDVAEGFGKSIPQEYEKPGLWQCWNQRAAEIEASSQLGKLHYVKSALEDSYTDSPPNFLNWKFIQSLCKKNIKPCESDHLPILSIQEDSWKPIKIEGVYKWSIGLDYFIRVYAQFSGISKNNTSARLLSTFMDLYQSDTEFQKFWKAFELRPRPRKRKKIGLSMISESRFPKHVA
ncbi:hypothetical protein DFH28DRAFT_992172 [Melampsora americana]|nr:hypothetical protein DFH28DRAFT_992172 [Melampsora americana]